MNFIENDEIKRMKRGLNWSELKKSLSLEGCPICNIMKKSLDKYFEFLLYEYALDPTVHKKMLASSGLCNTHTYLLKETEDKLKSDGLNIAVLYETLIRKEGNLLENILNKTFSERKKSIVKFGKKKNFLNHKKSILDELSSKGLCPGCIQQKESESFCTHLILKFYKDEEFQIKYGSEKILLCRRHFLFLIQETQDKEAVEYFIKIQKEKILNLYNQLSNFIDKHNIKLKSQPTEAEKISWEKVIEYFGSKKYN